MSSEWKPGDCAVTDKFPDGPTAIVLIERDERRPDYWLVAEAGISGRQARLYEDEFRRPGPVPAGQPSLRWPSPLNPLVAELLKASQGIRPMVWIGHIPNSQPLDAKGRTPKQRGVIADLLINGLDAVKRNLADLLACYGVAEDERKLILAQVEAGERATRETSAVGGRLAGIGRWMSLSADRRVNVSMRSQSIEVWVTTFPDIRAKHATFIGHTEAAEVPGLLDRVMADPRNDAVIEAGRISYGLGSAAIDRLEADLQAIDGCD